MSTKEKLLRLLGSMTSSQQRQVVEFAESISKEGPCKENGRNPIGLCAKLKLEIDASEIDDARKEMWPGYIGEDLP